MLESRPAPSRSRHPARWGDWDRIRRALRALAAKRGALDMTTIAEAAGLAPVECEALFDRWCGLTIEEIGAVLSKRSLAATLEAPPPGTATVPRVIIDDDTKSPRVLSCGVHETPFGEAAVAEADGKLVLLSFTDDEGFAGDALDSLRHRWPGARLESDSNAAAAMVDQIFGHGREPVRVALKGTPFDVRVWRALVAIPAGRASSYAGIARSIGRPQAARAVGAACGRNVIAFVVPCHRVLHSGGGIGGYGGGLTRKRAMIAWEAGRLR